jgi:hypothetical protein
MGFDDLNKAPKTKVEGVGEVEKSPEEIMDGYIAQFLGLVKKGKDYLQEFQGMVVDPSLDFFNNEPMVIRFVKGMGGDIMAVMRLSTVYREKNFLKLRF